MRFTAYQTVVVPKTWFLVLANIATFVIIFIVAYPLVPKDFQPTVFKQPKTLLKLYQFADKLIMIWFLGQIVSIIYSGGIPIFWYLTGDSRGYANYGIPTIGGTLHACYAVAITSYIILLRFYKSKRILRRLLLLLTWPILTVERAIGMVVLAQILAIVVMTNRLRPKKLVQILVLAIIVVIIFGMIGDFRLGANREIILSMFASQAPEFALKLPSGFLWVYLYATGGLNNVNWAIDSLQPTYTLNRTLVALVPTVIRSSVFDMSFANKYPLAMQGGFNTFTFYSNYLQDFGILGAIIVVTFYQIGIMYTYVVSLTGKLWALLIYATLFQAMLLSVFTDNFAILPTIAQLVIALIFKRVSTPKDQPMTTKDKIKRPPRPML